MSNVPGAPKKAFEIYNDNFNEYMSALVDGMTDAQRALLPHAILKKGFVKAGFRPSRLSFNELMYMAVTVFNKRMIILVDADEEDGAATIKTLNDAVLVSKRKKPLNEVAEDMITNAMFAMGDRELMDTVMSLRLVAQTQLWRHLMHKAAGKKKEYKTSGFRERRAIIKGMVGLLSKYDSLKSVIKAEHGIEFSEWYCLTFFFDGEKSPGEFHKTFRSAPGGKRSSLKAAVTRMIRMGYLMFRGTTRTRVYSLTAKGDELVMKIMERVFIQPAKAIKNK